MMPYNTLLKLCRFIKMNLRTEISVKYLIKTISIVALMLILSCGNNPDKETKVNPEKYKDNLEQVNKTLVDRENEDIEDYIARHEWQMQKTGTGLRYLIYKNGNGPKPVEKSKVLIRFDVKLINGKECYNSQKDGMKLIELGKAEVESGLEEGILLMKTGDRAKLILPSHLAFGLLGDENKIPKRATLIYDVELVEVK